jgi:ATP-dependent helicase HrpB
MNMSDLPILPLLPDITSLLEKHDQLILQAPPGAGKTTVIPTALLNEKWVSGKKIIMLEPRRLAARSAAYRLAANLQEKVGETVGYRIRLESRVSDITKIEVVTEGVFLRLLQADPSLDEVALVIFDEFHERSLEADLALALCLQAQELFRDEDPLKLLIMSATLDTQDLEQRINAHVLACQGKSFPVDIIYSQHKIAAKQIEQSVCDTVLLALREHSGSLLVFLPGQAEIRRVATQLTERLSLEQQRHIHITPLYGDLSLEEQALAIQPPVNDHRKIVLATSIAETSLTIEGINIVIDSGLSRSARYDLNTGMTRLHTHTVSQASTTQRAGRAGRLSTGICYRLWPESQQSLLPAFTPAEILQADLAPLLLQLYLWGCSNPNELMWLDPPSLAGINQARDLLINLGALQAKGETTQLTEHGSLLAELPMHPRLAHMIITAKRFGLERLACDLAALLSERDPIKSKQAELSMRIAWLQSKNSDQASLRQRIKSIANQLFQQIQKVTVEPVERSIDTQDAIGFLIASAWPDRIALNKGNECRYLLSNGRAAQLADDDYLRGSEWIAVANLGGKHTQTTDNIWLAERLNPKLFSSVLQHLTDEQDIVEWDEETQRISAERQQRCGAIIISKKGSNSDPSAIITVLCQVIRRKGLHILPWNPSILAWKERVNFVRSASKKLNLDEEQWPDLSDTALLDTLESWLSPYLNDVKSLQQLEKIDLFSILKNRLAWPLPNELDRLAPERIKVPSGNLIKIDYSQYPPVLAVKLQEMFGCQTTPLVAQSIPLQIHLLSPAGRALQVTQDLASFWKNSYPDVCKEMKGRYPKHPWPDNPLMAVATHKTKKHLS